MPPFQDIDVVLPQSVVETSYQLSRGDGARFITTAKAKGTQTFTTVRKLANSAVRLQIAVRPYNSHCDNIPEHIVIQQVHLEERDDIGESKDSTQESNTVPDNQCTTIEEHIETEAVEATPESILNQSEVDWNQVRKEVIIGGSVAAKDIQIQDVLRGTEPRLTMLQGDIHAKTLCIDTVENQLTFDNGTVVVVVKNKPLISDEEGDVIGEEMLDDHFKHTPLQEIQEEVVTCHGSVSHMLHDAEGTRELCSHNEVSALDNASQNELSDEHDNSKDGAGDNTSADQDEESCLTAQKVKAAVSVSSGGETIFQRSDARLCMQAPTAIVGVATSCRQKPCAKPRVTLTKGNTDMCPRKLSLVQPNQCEGPRAGVTSCEATSSAITVSSNKRLMSQSISDGDPNVSRDDQPRASLTSRKGRRSLACLYDACRTKIKDFHCLFKHLKRRHVAEADVEGKLEEARELMRAPCPHCDKVLSHRDQLAVHIKDQHTATRQECCPHCGKMAASASRLKAHVYRAHGSRRFLCHLCPSSFKMPKYLADHLQVVHVARASETELHRCDLCQYATPHRQYLKTHRIRIHGNKSYPCQQCGRSFGNTANLTRHEKLVHAPDGRAVKEHRCSDCGKEFSLAHNLKEHVMTQHRRVYRYLCAVCGSGHHTRKLVEKHAARRHGQVGRVAVVTTVLPRAAPVPCVSATPGVDQPVTMGTPLRLSSDKRSGNTSGIPNVTVVTLSAKATSAQPRGKSS